MSEVINPGNIQKEVPLDQLLFEVMKMKDKGLRFDQACAAYVNGKYELSYSFSEDDAYQFETLRVVIDLTDEVPSVSNIYHCASFYENEMRELFGVKIELLELDYENKLYRINVENPMLPEAGKKLLAEEEEKLKEEKAPDASQEGAEGPEGAAPADKAAGQKDGGAQ